MSKAFHLRITNSNGYVVELHGPADITQETTEAIVNAANSYLIGGGGVDGAIHDAGGPTILSECRSYVAKHGQLPAGRAMLTTGGKLAAKYVIHTVGPVYRGGTKGEHELLASCYRESINLAEANAIRSIAFPAISTGAYGYPIHQAASVAIKNVFASLEQTKSVQKVRFVLFDVSALKAYVSASKNLAESRPHYLFEEEPS